MSANSGLTESAPKLPDNICRVWSNNSQSLAEPAVNAPIKGPLAAAITRRTIAQRRRPGTNLCSLSCEGQLFQGLHERRTGVLIRFPEVTRTSLKRETEVRGWWVGIGGREATYGHIRVTRLTKTGKLRDAVWGSARFVLHFSECQFR